VRKRVEDWLTGVRPGFGEGARIVQVARSAERRSGLNWAIPALAAVFFLCLLAYQKAEFGSLDGFGGMFFRIFVFDYSIFAFGLLSGWNMARRWRSNSDQVEELSLTPLTPTVAGTMMTAGPVGIWLAMIVGVGAVDLATPVAQASEIGRFQSGGAAAAILGLGAFLSAGLTPLCLAWFHFESARLAHWMFVVHALPRVSLVRAGIANFIMMTIIVMGLSAVGCATTGVFWIVIAVIPASVLSGMTGVSANAIQGSYVVWATSVIPSLLFIVWLKRVVARSYERQFVRAWLLYQWWGAGESTQPSSYPKHFQSALGVWALWLGMQEEEAAGLPPRRRRHTQVYHALQARRGQAADRPPAT